MFIKQILAPQNNKEKSKRYFYQEINNMIYTKTYRYILFLEYVILSQIGDTMYLS